MMKAALIFVLMAIAGCASQMMEGYLGKDITEVIMDRGTPSGAIDLPDGRRAFMWTSTQTSVAPVTTSYSGSAYGGTAMSYGGSVSRWDCTYTFIGQRNPRGSYTVVDFRQPSLMCE